MENIDYLIEKIKESNLSDTDKSILIEKLNKTNPDIDGFLKTFISICKVSKEVLKLFDCDIGDF